MNIPDNLLYTKTHEWAQVNDLEVTVGITDYACGQLNREIVHVELPTVGTKARQEESFGALDAVKASFDLYAPVSGEIVAVNKEVIENPTIVGSSPYYDGWMIKVAMSNPLELKKLLRPEEYGRLLDSEGSH